MTDEEKSKDTVSAAESDLAKECLRENLVHARHIEIERVTFVALFSVMAGGALAAVPQMNGIDAYIKIIIVVTLMLLNIVCMLLVRRWNEVFSVHMAAAEKNLKLLCTHAETKICGDDFFIFNFKKKKFWRTRRLFFAYNLLLFALLLAFFCFILAGVL